MGFSWELALGAMLGKGAAKRREYVGWMVCQTAKAAAASRAPWARKVDDKRAENAADALPKDVRVQPEACDGVTFRVNASRLKSSQRITAGDRRRGGTALGAKEHMPCLRSSSTVGRPSGNLVDGIVAAMARLVHERSGRVMSFRAESSQLELPRGRRSWPSDGESWGPRSGLRWCRAYQDEIGEHMKA